MNLAWKWTPENEAKARKRLGVKAYRPGQRELIQAVMEGRNALGILPTGGGKSLCYQLPALFFPKAILVISPLISLMRDQLEKLTDRKIASTHLNSTLSSGEEREAVDDIRDGEAELIYITPERLENADYLALLRKTGVSLIVVDEAHCVSQWGHSFRPAYLAIRDAVRKLGRPPVLALTATATHEVAQDILTQLGIADATVVNLGIARDNLFFEVIRTVNEEEKFERLVAILRGLREGPGIVYVPTVRQANDLWQRLRHADVEAGCYHGKMKTADRERSQQAFMDDAYPVMVATKAFGMGIDKANLRLVLHYAFPDSLESYVQEAGRAGRDGKPAHAVLFYRLEDKRVQAYFLGGKYPRREESLRVYEAIGRLGSREAGGTTFPALVEETGLPKNQVRVIVALLESTGIVTRHRRLHKVRDFADAGQFGDFLDEYERRHANDRDRLHTMMRYGQTTTCRVRFLCSYFGQELTRDCGHCDNCRSGVTQQVVDVRHYRSTAS